MHVSLYTQSQDNAPFSLESETICFNSEDNKLHTDAAISSIAWHLEATYKNIIYKGSRDLTLQQKVRNKGCKYNPNSYFGSMYRFVLFCQSRGLVTASVNF